MGSRVIEAAVANDAHSVEYCARPCCALLSTTTLTSWVTHLEATTQSFDLPEDLPSARR